MRYAAFLIFTLVTGCVSTLKHSELGVDFSPSPKVTATEVLRIAEAYRKHVWTPTEQNVFHGRDAKGILVNTPDINLDPEVAARPGWWVSGKSNVGIPYQWGGFDTPTTFDQKISDGYYGGDVYTRNKRSKLYGAVSDYACGVDCSGFISRCWRLSRPHSTRELPAICEQLESYDELQPGDIVNKKNVHVLLFERFLDEKKTQFLAYETGSPPSWKVLKHPISVDYVNGLGYKPYRYRNIEQDAVFNP